MTAASQVIATVAQQRRATERAGLALLFVGAVALSALTILKGFQPNDEGLMLQAAARIAGGEVPYRDFWWFYPPGQPYLLAALWKVFGPSLLTWRILRVLTNGAVALLAYLLARRSATRGAALVAWAAGAVALAEPTGPHPYPVALALALGSLLVFDRSPVLAGVLAGACGAWRIEFAGYLGVAVLCSYAIRPGPGRWGTAARFAASGAVTAALLLSPVVLQAGLGRSWDLLIRYPIEDFGDYQSLPFPLHYKVGFDFGTLGAARNTISAFLSFYLPLVLVVGLAGAVLSLALRFGREQWQRVALAVFAGGMVHYLLTRPDAYHTGPLAVTVAIMAAWVLAAIRDPAQRQLDRWRGRRVAPLALVPAVVAAFAVAWILADGLQRSERQVEEHMVPVRLDVADGVRQFPRYNCSLPGDRRVQVCTLADLERAVGFVRRRVPPGRPIYVGTQRSDLVTSGAPILYVLTGRPSATRYDIAAPGVVTSAPVQREIVRELEDRGLPLVIRWTASITAAPEPNRAGRSTGVRILDAFLARRYRRTARFGSYVILEART